MRPLLRNSLFVLFVITSFNVSSGQQDTLFFDPQSGNYVIKYIGEFMFVRGLDASLRPASKDEPLAAGEQLVQRDSLIVVIFEPSTKISPSIGCTVSRDPQSGLLRYSYRLANGADSKQRLINCTVKFGRGAYVSDITPKDGWHSARVFEAVYDSLALSNRWRWWGDIGLAPSRSWTVGALASSGLPALTTAYFQGKAPVISFPDEGPGYHLHTRISELQVFPANHVVRKTIGPANAPVPFVASNFLDTLASYKHQAFTLGWITNKGIFNSLDQKLDNARKQLERGNNRAAKNILEAFINEVEAQKEKHLSSEAHALLKFNAEYLISKLE